VVVDDQNSLAHRSIVPFEHTSVVRASPETEIRARRDLRVRAGSDGGPPIRAYGPHERLTLEPSAQEAIIMTQIQQVDRRTAVATSAFVAALVSAAITVSALLLVPALTAAPMPDAPVAARPERVVEAGRAWQRQRLMESPAHWQRMHALEQSGVDWQLRYEQITPSR
jgi:hypothetical protein